MDESRFPCFNHPFYPDGTQDQSFIDYGSISSYDLDISEDSTVTTRSKHCHHGHDQNFIGAHACIPFLPPAKSVFPSRILPDIQVRASKCRTDFKPTIIKQISDFYRDFPDIGLAAGKNIINQEAGSEPWNLGCLPRVQRIHQLTTDGQRALLDPKNGIERFCKWFVTIPLKKYADVKFNKTTEIHIPKGLRESIQDIPPELLFDLTNESVEELKDEMLYFDLLQGNVLSYCKLPNSGDINGALFYPSGSTLESLNMKFVKSESVNIDNSEEEWTSFSKPILVDAGIDVTVNGAIRQIDAAYHEHGGITIATRSRHSCSFFKTSEDISETTLHTIDTFECEDELVNVALSPFIHGDAVAITKTGHIHTWKCGKKSDIAKVPSLAPEKKWPWYQCVYADHPRCIVIVNPVEADIFDLRVNSLSSKGFFSITSKQVELHERISAVQRHPDNTHHYLMATDQSLMIMDDRFVHHPVLKWHHHLQDPVQFIEIVPNVVPDSNDTVVMVTGSYHRETHCYQYCSGERKVSRTLAMMGNSVVTPPVSTRLPWKVSSYDEWPSLLPISTLPLSSALEDRLTTPLIGISCIPATSQAKSGFSVLQMSAPGDIFYQPFIPRTRNQEHQGYQGNQMRDEAAGMQNLSCQNVAFCREWIRDLIAMEQDNDEIQNWPLKSNILETDCHSQFESMISLEEPHPSCALCTDDSGGVFESAKTRHDAGSCECPRCGIDVVTGIQLQKAKKQNDVATSRPCTLGEQSVNLNIFPNANEFKNCVSQGFLQNWYSTEPRPLELINTTDDTNNNSKTLDNQEGQPKIVVKSQPDSEEMLEVKCNIQGSVSIPNDTSEENVTSPLTSSVSMATPQPMTSSVSMATPQPMTSSVSMVTPQPMTSSVSMATPQPMTSSVSMATPQPMMGSVSMEISQPATSKLSPVKKTKKRKLDLSMGF